MQTNRSTFGILFYLNTSKTKKSGKCPIVGRISVDGKSTAFSTGLDVLPEQWDAKSGLATGKSKETDSINRQIESYRTEITNHYKNMVSNNSYVTAEYLKNALRGIGTNQNTLLQEFSEYLEECRQSVGINKVYSTYRMYFVAYNHLKDFIRFKYDAEDMAFGQIDYAFVEAYDYYLKIDKGMTPRTVEGNVLPFRRVVRRAINKGMVRQDPFFNYIPTRVRPKRRWLSNEEIERIMTTPIAHRSANFVRDMFILSCWTGLSYVDVRNLKESNINEMEDDSKWIVINRQKTGTPSYIPLLDIPMHIIEKYRGTGKDGKLFNLMKNSEVNLYLKTIAKAAGIDKRLTYHMSRFSFATTVCLSQGVPIESLSQMMEHKNIKTTQIYAEVTKTKINEDMTNLEKRIEGKYELAGG
jgi:site-specific recombinase XerD